MDAKGSTDVSVGRIQLNFQNVQVSQERPLGKLRHEIRRRLLNKLLLEGKKQIGRFLQWKKLVAVVVQARVLVAVLSRVFNKRVEFECSVMF